MFFSRNSNDVTQIYGPKLSSHVKSALDENVLACVLDGEVIVWDNELGRAAPFGQNKAVANQQFEDFHNDNPRYYLIYKVFDILFVKFANEDSEKQMVQKSLSERKITL